MEEWKEYKLGDVINVLDNKRIPLSSKERSTRKGNFPYYGAQGIIDYINDFIFNGTYLLIAEDGENLKSQKQDIAQLATGKFWVNNHAHIVESNGLCDIRYLCYLINRMDLSGYITGSAQPKLNQANLLSIIIRLPLLRKQQYIANFISMFDDKIELNRRINENLEQQAQALFNYYFIEHSEILGDYEKGNLTEIATYTNGLPMQKFRPQDEEKGMPVLKIKELGQGQTDNSSDICSENIANEYKVTNGDVIFSWSGTLMVKVWCGGLCGLNQHLFKVTSEKYPKWYYYFWTKFHLNKFIRIAQDKAVTMGHIRRGDLESSEVLVPKMDILAKLNEIINPIFNQIIGIECENRNLAQLRDTLLPRLMSGELAITDVDDRSIFQ